MELLYGKSPILEALRAQQRRVKKFYYLGRPDHSPALSEVLDLLAEKNIPTENISREYLERRLPGLQTQGWLAEVSPFICIDRKQLLSQLEDKSVSLLLALDQIQDPQNVGAIFRTAEASGVDGIFMPEKHSCPLSPAVSKASAGALEHLKIARIANLAQILKNLKQQGYWVVGTHVEKAENALTFDWPAKMVLVLGAEGKGMRRLTQEHCDFLVHLPLLGNVESLNVSATAAACLYLRQQKLLTA